MKFTTRDLVTLAVFGTLWGLVEMSLGSVLHGLKIPFTGATLSAIGLAIAVTGRLFVNRRGSTLFIGVIAMLLKLLSIGSVVIGPMIGILVEALLAEGALSLFPRPSRLGFLIACELGVLSTVAQPFVTGPLLFGRQIIGIWLDLLDTGSRWLGVDESAILWILAAILALHLLLGGVSGWLAWDGGRLLLARLRGTSLSSSEI